MGKLNDGFRVAAGELAGGRIGIGSLGLGCGLAAMDYATTYAINRVQFDRGVTLDELTEFVPSYDGRNPEPVVLPSKLPLLLMLGTEGIAVGLSSRVLPHNFPELLQAQIAILKKQPFKLLPDFPTGGLMDARDYRDGQGTVKVRAKIKVKDAATVVIQDLPPATTTESLTASIEGRENVG